MIFFSEIATPPPPISNGPPLNVFRAENVTITMHNNVTHARRDVASLGKRKSTRAVGECIFTLS